MHLTTEHTEHTEVNCECDNEKDIIVFQAPRKIVGSLTNRNKKQL
jgi:hypothetical protein